MEHTTDHFTIDERHGDTPPAPAGASRVLSIGSADLPPKEQALLRSLVRLLENQCPGVRLQATEQPAAGAVVFVPADWPHRLPPDRVCVRVRHDPGAADQVKGGLWIEAPLRASNVASVLRAAVEHLAKADAHGSGLAALFHAVVTRLVAHERRATVFTFADTRRVCVRFTEGVVLGDVALDDLLRGDYGAIEIRRAESNDLAQLDTASATPFRLRDFVWLAAFRLGQDEAGPLRASGVQYRLTRWPDAIALTRPGIPKLAALLTTRPMSLAQASAAAGTSAAMTHRFVEACVALGLATMAIDAGSQAAPVVTEGASASAGLLSRLRERLRLW